MVFSQYMCKELERELMSSKCSFMTQLTNMKEKCMFVSQILRALVQSSLKKKKKMMALKAQVITIEKVVISIKNKKVIIETMESLKTAMNMMNITNMMNMTLEKNIMIMKDKRINKGENIEKLKDSKMKRTSKIMILEQGLKM